MENPIRNNLPYMVVIPVLSNKIVVYNIMVLFKMN